MGSRSESRAGDIGILGASTGSADRPGGRLILFGNDEGARERAPLVFHFSATAT